MEKSNHFITLSFLTLKSEREMLKMQKVKELFAIYCLISFRLGALLLFDYIKLPFQESFYGTIDF